MTRLDPTVRTCQGTVRGAVVDGVNVFRGIPYAAPPFGPNRLRPPAAASHGPAFAMHSSMEPMPPQLSPAGTDAGPFIPAGGAPGEDCLNLNIWTPDLGAPAFRS